MYSSLELQNIRRLLGDFIYESVIMEANSDISVHTFNRLIYVIYNTCVFFEIGLEISVSLYVRAI